MNNTPDCLNLPISKWHSLELESRLYAIESEANQIRAEMVRRKEKGVAFNLPKVGAPHSSTRTDC